MFSRDSVHQRVREGRWLSSRKRNTARAERRVKDDQLRPVNFDGLSGIFFQADKRTEGLAEPGKEFLSEVGKERVNEVILKFSLVMNKVFN